MLTKIVLAMNPEIDDHTIRNTINNRVNDSFVQYCAEDSIVFNRMVSNIKHSYPSNITDWFINRQFNSLVELFSDDELIKFFETAFYKANDLIYYRFEADTYGIYNLSGKVVMPIGFDGSRPQNAVFIGWVSEQNTDHLMEHEGLTEENAKRVQRALDTILRKNKDMFDTFFDGNSVEEVMEYIRSL